MMVITGGDDEQESEIVYINPSKDVWRYSIPLTHDKEGQTEEFKKLAAKALAEKILEQIEPEYLEQKGFELMQYSVIIKKHN